ncbi:MAG: hypothetical protein M5T61_13930 [Acidimicrobiia bacterium]|nr:hypothetical protein [Acidimicrobiia bacterium]
MATAMSNALIRGPPLNDAASSKPAGSEKVLSFIPRRAAVAARASAKPSRLPEVASAMAYAASFAETMRRLARA